MASGDMDVRVREAAVSMRVVDGNSLLTPALMGEIVAAVLRALAAQREDERSQRRDTRIGGGCGCDDPQAGA
jgi:hypothetical protein